jgi:glycosyltransferase involved in cell wall biosynthesis
MANPLFSYINKRSFVFDAQILTSPISIVIPSCNEYPTIKATLDSLVTSVKNIDSKLFTVIVVVNNRCSASPEVIENNKKTLNFLECYEKMDVKSLSLINTVPEKEGVGYARKYGMDYALRGGSSVISCMDADTIVSENYLSELFTFYEKVQKNPRKYGLALTQFTHQKTENAELQEAIDAYEKYMKDHSEKLKLAGTPFFPVALGPTLVCSADMYAASGGMPKKLSGEDFYFLQSCIKTSLQQKREIVFLDSVVYPEPRLSDRVLFGTGPKLKGVLTGQDSIAFHKNSSYKMIGDFINFIEDWIKKENLIENLSNQVFNTFPTLWYFLESESFFSLWFSIYENNKKSKQKLITSFYTWFDGLKIIRLIHFLEK